MSTTSPVLPPLDGSLTLTPGFVDFHAKHNANLPWAVFPSRDDPTKIDSVSFAELAKASHRIAHRARPGRTGSDGEVVGLLIHCDALLYAAIIHGLARAGLVVSAIDYDLHDLMLNNHSSLRRRSPSLRVCRRQLLLAYSRKRMLVEF